MQKQKNTLIKQALCWLLVIMACLAVRVKSLPAMPLHHLRAFITHR